MWVVKLGGSLAESEWLPRWLKVLADRQVVIVPGGGPFADAVRSAQTRWRFDEQAAHEMAIVAMQQYGRMLLGLQPGLRPARSPADMAGRLPAVWLPEPEALNAAGMPASWDITSDSLAAWLAVEIGAPHLLLVKSVQADGHRHWEDCRELIKRGLIDPAFRDYGRNTSLQSWWCGPEDHACLPDALLNPGEHFVRISAHSS